MNFTLRSVEVDHIRKVDIFVGDIGDMEQYRNATENCSLFVRIQIMTSGAEFGRREGR